MRQERFTEQAQEALARSQELVRQYQHNQWDVEHILLALLQQEHGLVGDMLGELGVNTEALKKKVEDALDKVPKVAYQAGQIFATPRIAQLLESAGNEADRLKDEFVGTEHLLIAMVGESGGASSILKSTGLDQEKVYAVTLHSDEVRVIFTGVEFKSTFAEFLNELRKAGITPNNVAFEVIDGTSHITLILDRVLWEKIKTELKTLDEMFKFKSSIEDTDISTISIHGIGITIEKEIFNIALGILNSHKVEILSINQEPKKLEMIVVGDSLEALVKKINEKINIEDGI